MSRRPGPPSIDGLHSLKVDNIAYHTNQHDLRRLFDKYGEIGDIYIPRDRYTKQSRGFAFVRFHSRRDAEHAMDRMDGKLVEGRELRVSIAKYDRPVDERYTRGRSRSRSRSPRRTRSPPERSPRRSSRRSPSPRRSRSRSASPRKDRSSHSRSSSRD